MPKLVSSRIIERVLLHNGFSFISQRGSHAKFSKGKLTVILPMAKKEVPVGTMASIARQSGIAMELFQKGK